MLMYGWTETSAWFWYARIKYVKIQHIINTCYGFLLLESDVNSFQISTMEGDDQTTFYKNRPGPCLLSGGEGLGVVYHHVSEDAGMSQQNLLYFSPPPTRPNTLKCLIVKCDWHKNLNGLIKILCLFIILCSFSMKRVQSDSHSESWRHKIIPDKREAERSWHINLPRCVIG